MRSLAISPNATFHTTHRWAKGMLPIALPWRSTLWRYIVPALWIAGWMFWVGVVSIDTPQGGVIFYALLFIGIPLILALTAVWWVRQLLSRRTSGTLIINDDYLEWQFESGSDIEFLSDCGRFGCVGTRNARIEWDLANADQDTSDGWRTWAKRWRLLDSFKSDRVLHGRDVGLDQGELDGLCKLLNQLRDEATASR